MIQTRRLGEEAARPLAGESWPWDWSPVPFLFVQTSCAVQLSSHHQLQRGWGEEWTMYPGLLPYTLALGGPPCFILCLHYLWSLFLNHCSSTSFLLPLGRIVSGRCSAYSPFHSKDKTEHLASRSCLCQCTQ